MSMYPESMTSPVRAEFEGTPIVELKTPEAVGNFMKESGRKVLFINSMCGRAGHLARPSLIHALSNPIKPQKMATIFAGVDQEAIEAYKLFLPPHWAYSSPSFLFMRDEEMVYYIPRGDIDPHREDYFYEYLAGVYNHFMGEKIDPHAPMPKPF